MKRITFRDQFMFHAIVATPVLLLILLVLVTHAHAETYNVDGKTGQTKLSAIVAMANNPKAHIERCKFTEKTDSNEGAVVCRTVELSPRGTLRLQK